MKLLDSPDWRVRADALFKLHFVPHSQLPPRYHEKVIALLNEEARHPVEDSTAAGEAVGDYQMDLVSQALAFKDPAALPGFAYLGIQMGRDVEDFVATQGSAALPYLDSAWTTEPDARPDIMETWALMVGEHRNRITAAERIQLLGRLVRAAPSEKIGFDGAALLAPLPTASPIIQMIGQSGQSTVVREDAAEVLDTLMAIRETMSASQLHADLTDWLQAICLDATAAKAMACDTLTDLLAADPPDAHALSSFKSTADVAFRHGTLTPFEHALLAANADSLLHDVLARVPTWAPGVTYTAGDSVTYNGLYYQCRQAHTSRPGWEPPKMPALWTRKP